VKRIAPWLLAIAGGALYFLGFAGFGIWPLAFVALVPLAVAVDLEKDASAKRHFALGFLYGFVEYTGGYYWMVSFLDTFSGFGTPLAILIASVFFAFQALQMGILAWLYGRGRARGHSPALLLPVLNLAMECLWPQIFPSHISDGLHAAPMLIQIVDLGGTYLLSALVSLVNGAFAALVIAKLTKQTLPRLAPALAAVSLGLTLAYGAYRIGEVDARARTARTLHVGMVQVNMGTYAKREDPREGHRRHLEQSRTLERLAEPDLIVWPESGYTDLVPDLPNVRRYVTQDITTPVLFGGLSMRRRDDARHLFNTAFLLDADGDVLGSYDKTYLVPFGEFIPFGDVFPSLYELSPNTGHFTPGDHVRPVVLDGIRMSLLVCYEDVIPAFTRRAVREGNPHLLVNLTNDAWYGDTHEPWIHLALAKFRAVEHHRALVRSTNSGVSAFVDPVGRVIANSQVFTREELDARLPLLTGHTVYETVGDQWAWLFVAIALYAAFGRARTKRDAPTPA
jgi:apolipoprotein N-acyltransferase